MPLVYSSDVNCFNMGVYILRVWLGLQYVADSEAVGPRAGLDGSGKSRPRRDSIPSVQDLKHNIEKIFWINPQAHVSYTTCLHLQVR
jgi:hypothetical protein